MTEPCAPSARTAEQEDWRVLDQELAVQSIRELHQKTIERRGRKVCKVDKQQCPCDVALLSKEMYRLQERLLELEFKEKRG